MVRKVTSLLLLAAASSVGFVVGCEGKVDLGSNEPTGSAVGQAPPSASAAPSSTGTDPAPSATETIPAKLPPVAPLPDATLAEVKARCADPAHGPIDPYADYDGLKTRLIGRWYACSSTEGMEPDPHTGQLIRPELYSREAGIEFVSDQTWHLLRVADDGTFASQLGIEGQGTWGEKYEKFIEYFQVNWQLSPTLNMELTQFDFESSPRRLRVVNYMSKATTWFVPIAIASGNPGTR
jgi:hypothetical protein